MWVISVLQLNTMLQCNGLSETSGDHSLSYKGHALSDVLDRKLVALLIEAEYIWGNLKYNEANLLTFNLN